MRQVNLTGLSGVTAATLLLVMACAGPARAGVIVVDFADLEAGTQFGCRDHIVVGDVQLGKPEGVGRGGFCGRRASSIESISVDGQPRQVLQFGGRDWMIDFDTELTNLSLILVNPEGPFRIFVNDGINSNVMQEELDGLVLGGVSLSASVPAPGLLQIDFSGSIERFVFGAGNTNQILQAIATPVPEPWSGVLLAGFGAVLARRRGIRNPGGVS